MICFAKNNNYYENENNTKPFLQKYVVCRGSVWYDGDEEHSERGPHKEGQHDNIFKKIYIFQFEKIITDYAEL
jgi:hypothetical protein